MTKLIKNWKELAKVGDSETHRLEVTPDNGNGWVVEKETGKFVSYLSTHTFYGECHENSTRKLKSYGFDVELDNWDK